MLPISIRLMILRSFVHHFQKTSLVNVEMSNARDMNTWFALTSSFKCMTSGFLVKSVMYFSYFHPAMI